jgi:cytochrome c556
MQELGVRMAALTHGLMVDSAELVAHNAKLMAEHAPIAADELARLQRTLGRDMAEFERIDTETHGRLVRLRDAAAARASDDVLTRLNEVQRGCVECHSRFRNRLRTDAAASPAR